MEERFLTINVDVLHHKTIAVYLRDSSLLGEL